MKYFKLLFLHWLPSSAEFQQKKSDFSEQINKLKKELEIHSKVCEYIKKTSVEGMWVYACSFIFTLCLKSGSGLLLKFTDSVYGLFGQQGGTVTHKAPFVQTPIVLFGV